MRAWAEIREGDALEPGGLGPITRTDIVRYQGASGDMNPIHHDEPFAKGAGYPAPLVVGMYPAGALSAWAAAQFGVENTRRVRIRWKTQLWPGDELRFEGTVTRKLDAGDGAGERRVEVETRAITAKGELALEVWLSFAVPK